MSDSVPAGSEGERHFMHTGRDVGTLPHPIPSSDAHVLTSLRIPMSDGVELCADLYLPGGAGPFPGIVEVTPYGAQGLSYFGRVYAGRGFLFLAVDCRGRYRSAGTWEPLSHDQLDGHSVLKWLAAHELCNGRIGTRGHSYSGYNQLLTAIDAPDSLQAMVVGVAPGDPFKNVPFQGGAYDLNDLFWLIDIAGRVRFDDGTRAAGKFDDPDEFGDEEEDEEDYEDSAEDRERDELLDQAMSSRPFVDVDLRLGIYHEHFRQWVSHWSLDDYWLDRSVGPRLEQTAVPTLHISGWWDGNGYGAPNFYAGMRARAGSEAARQHQRLLIGPWNHDLEAPDCDDLPDDEITVIERAALRDSLNDELAWFDQHLMDLPVGPANQERVSLFVTGINRWLDFSDWPIPDASVEKLYLAAARRGTVGGLMSDTPQSDAKPATYRFDPENPTPYGPSDTDCERLPFDAAQIQHERTDLLLFDHEVLNQPLWLIGPVSLVLYAAASTPDFDLCAKLCDVHPDGRSIFLTDGVFRARFVDGFDQPRSITPHSINAYELDLWHIGHRLNVGHKLRLEVCSGAHLRFDINPCTGTDLATEIETQVADITIYLDTELPSHLLVPVYEPGDAGLGQ